MKVQVCKSVDVEAYVDVEIEDVLNEGFARFNEEGLTLKGVLPIIDSATRLLAKVTDGMIAGFSEQARGEILKRLTAEVARYQETP
jgi:hypothetical protein